MSDTSQQKLVIGSAQFGMPYGVGSGYRMVSEEEVLSILRFANKHRISAIDTASAYGNAEALLGRLLPDIGNFKIITKLPSLKEALKSKNISEIITDLFNASLQRLGTNNVHGLLIHNCQDLLGETGEEIYAQLTEWKKNGLIKKIGVSIYEASQAEKLLSRYRFDIVQVPVNLLDQRLILDGTLSNLKNAGIEIHARSIFLQGLLLMQEQKLPPSFSRVRPALQFFNRKIKSSGLTPLAATLGFVNQNPAIDHIVIGIHSRDQLEQCIDAFSEALPVDFTDFAYSDHEAIDPRCWVV